jgi:broad specificity phosphatase PhoE
MPTLYLVRHGRPTGTWGDDPDPGLDPVGHEQARQLAEALAELQAVGVLSSPLRRCRETAEPFAARVGRKALLLTEISEIPAPPLDPKARAQWLSVALRGTWSEMQATAPKGSPDFLAWRRRLLQTLIRQPADAVIFTHYIAINTAVAAARGVDHVVCFRPDHASVTRIAVDGQNLRIIELGHEAAESLTVTQTIR